MPQHGSRKRGLETLGWPERLPGQPFWTWFIPGMPLPLCGVMLVPAMMLYGVYGVMATGNPASSWFAIMAVVQWPVAALVNNLALYLIWMFTGDAPGSFFEVYPLMLRAQTLLMLVEGALLIVALAAPVGIFLLLVRVVLSAGIYMAVMEFDLGDACRIGLFVGALQIITAMFVWAPLLAALS